MKIVSFISQGRAGYGLLRGDDEIVDCSQSLPYPDVRSALAAGSFNVFLPFVNAPATLKASEVSWLPPVPNPDKIICVGLNYRPHLLETGRAEPDRPTLFLRLPSSQVGHQQPLLAPPESSQFDYEGELAVVIGKGGAALPSAMPCNISPVMPATTTAACATGSDTARNSLPVKTSATPRHLVPGWSVPTTFPTRVR